MTQEDISGAILALQDHIRLSNEKIPTLPEGEDKQLSIKFKVTMEKTVLLLEAMKTK
jgi:hypothetical protein